jgi:hypothetical protein
VAKKRSASTPKPEAPTTISVRDAAEDLGVTTRWIRAQIANGVISPGRAGNKETGRYALTAQEVEALATRAAEDPTAGGAAMLARFSQLEAERANLLAQVAWERAIAQEQQKALEAEHARVTELGAELERQRAELAEERAEVGRQRDRVEQLKSLSAWDRVRGRHKGI